MKIENILNLFFSILFVISVGILYINYEGYDSVDLENIKDKKYINPAEFKVGDIKMDGYKSANLCNDKVLYPINSLNVDYDNDASKKECDCQEFIQSP